MMAPLHVLTFDIEDWYLSYHSSQIPLRRWPELESRTRQNTLRILTLLSEFGIKATFFILGYEAEKDPELVRLIAEAGHEIGFHSYYHIPPKYQSRDAFESDLIKGLEKLREISQRKVNFYRAPIFSLNAHSAYIIEVLQTHGIIASSSAMEGVRVCSKKVPPLPFKWPGDLMEFPLPTLSVAGLRIPFSGGGYFRALPTSLIHRLAQKRMYNMWYFHPRDFDDNPPSTRLLPWYRNHMNHLGTKCFMEKFRKLLKRFRFISLGEAYNLWSNFSDLEFEKNSGSYYL